MAGSPRVTLNRAANTMSYVKRSRRSSRRSSIWKLASRWFGQILKTHRLFEGPCQRDLPDLRLVWNRDAPIRKIYSPGMGLIERSPDYHRTGDHRSKGFFLTIGPGIRRGNLPPISNLDLAPDICSGLGVTLEVDGSRPRSQPDTTDAR